MSNEIRPTLRGFMHADFNDSNGKACSIQESSAAEGNFLWLGMNTGTHHMGDCMARMHLDRKRAWWLCIRLFLFALIGRLR